MKYLIHCVLLLLSIVSLHAQQTNTQNYIISRQFKQAGDNVNDVSKVITQVEYVDGLGRPLQNVLVGQGPDGKDIVRPFQYDAQGRQSKSFLPYAAAGKGAYQASAVSSQSSFYSVNDASLGLDASDLGRPYSETIYEKSPLNRPATLQAPGNKSATSTIEYKVNGATDVKRYDIDGTSVSQNGNWPAGSLKYSDVKDEEQKTTRQYFDLGGRLICKMAAVSETEILATYYIYDDLGLLRVVLQPQYQDDPSLSNYAFNYTYDTRGRIITKSIPGAGLISLVYDKYDRIVLSQDAKQLIDGLWSFIKYDVQNRPIMTGEVKSGNNQSTWQGILDGSSAHHESATSTGVGYVFPNVTEPTGITESNVQTVTYYDTYSFPNAGNLTYRATSGFYPNASASAKSLVTGGRTRVLPGNGSIGGWMANAIYYDDESRAIQAIRELYDLGAGSVECVSTEYKYNYAAVISRQKTEQILGGTVSSSHQVTNTYDHSDRLLDAKEKVTVGTVSRETYTVAHRYNVLGQLKSRWLHSDDNAKYRRRTDYIYNIRGWTTKGETFYKEKETDPESSYYSFGLEYVNGANYSNGNISAMRWSNKDEDSFTSGMGFLYDGANRLTGSTSLLNYTDLETDIKYDKNGNIKQLKRTGSAVDDLVYSYTGWGNRLRSITDNSGDNSGVKNGSVGYDYDQNGNVKLDGQRSASISYNYLNLPKAVTIGGVAYTYDYDASGNKHKYSVPGNAIFRYAGIAQYREISGVNSLHRISLNEGQAIIAGGAILFNYYLKDHLGNVRVVFDEDGTVLQRTDYYPFGLSIARDEMTEADRNEVNRYQLAEKEVQAGTGYIDYGARMYMPEIGRWGVVDAMAEKNGNLTGYNYAVNNPMLYVDPIGLDTLSENTGHEVKQGDVIQFANGTSAIQSANEATVRGQGYETLQNVSLPGYGIARNPDNGTYSRYKQPEGNKDFVDPFLLSLDIIYQTNFSGANNGDPNYKGGSGPGAAFGKIIPLSSNLWKVGRYKDIRGIEAGLDAHHVGQKAIYKELISDYDPNVGPAILVPKLGHTIGTGVVSRSTEGLDNVRSVLARDIKELRKVYPGIPNTSLQELIQLNKTMYPIEFLKTSL